MSDDVKRPAGWEKRVLAAFLFMTNRKETQKSVARRVGVTDRTVRNWIEDPTWNEARAEARDRWMGDVEDAARATVITSIQGGNAALAWELLQRTDEKFTPKSKHELTGRDGGPIETRDASLDNLSTDDLASLATTLAAEVAKP